ncbi:MAG: CHASE domain-containing protein [Candidatus Protistobacter heckmanni]|nr:CHASE domain-containing protein [Candidatus Protistobacter heckmanni]
MPGRLVGVVVLVLGLLATGVLYQNAVVQETSRRGTEINRLAGFFRLDLTNRIQAYIDTLPGLRAFCQLEENPNDLQFANYVKLISLQNRYPDLAITFVARSVKGKDATAFTEATRRDFSLNPDGHPEFRIKPFGQRDEHLVIRHLYPFVPATFGYDLYDPSQAYRSYAEAAITRGEAVATPPIVLAKDRTVGAKPDTVSVVVRLPVYRRGTNPQSEEERKAAAWGLVGVGFRILDLVGNILSAEMLEGMDLRIVDTQALTAGGTSLIFDTSWMKLSPTEVSKRSATLDTRQPTLSLRVPVGETASGRSRPSNPGA